MYARGDIAWGLCERCGLRYLLNWLVLDGYYPNIRVCEGCYDPPQPQERLAVVSDAVALWRPSPDTISISAPLLLAQQVGLQVILTWSGFNHIPPPPPGQVLTDNFKPGQGKTPIGSSGGANITAGYLVNRSSDGGLTYTQLANLVNTADEFGALSVETNTYADTPGPGTFSYQVVGYDVLFGDSYG